MKAKSCRTRKYWATLFMIPIASALGLAAVAAQDNQPADAITVHDGVYTLDQAERGNDAFQDSRCFQCHGNDMRGTPGGPSLVGGLFMLHWNNATADDLFAFMQANMPPGQPGSLGRERYADLLAAIFQANGFPAGENELQPGELENILITRE